MSGRCKACDAELKTHEIYQREVLPGVFVWEDLCVKCRHKIFSVSDPEEFDLISGLGSDAEGYWDKEDL